MADGLGAAARPRLVRRRIAADPALSPPAAGAPERADPPPVERPRAVRPGGIAAVPPPVERPGRRPPPPALRVEAKPPEPTQAARAARPLDAGEVEAGAEGAVETAICRCCWTVRRVEAPGPCPHCGAADAKTRHWRGRAEADAYLARKAREGRALYGAQLAAARLLNGWTPPPLPAGAPPDAPLDPALVAAGVRPAVRTARCSRCLRSGPVSPRARIDPACRYCGAPQPEIRNWATTDAASRHLHGLRQVEPPVRGAALQALQAAHGWRPSRGRSAKRRPMVAAGGGSALDAARARGAAEAEAEPAGGRGTEGL